MTGVNTTFVGNTTPVVTGVRVRQLSRGGVAAVWAAAALPMGILAWVVAPAIAGRGATGLDLAEPLIGAICAGLVWQSVLVVALVGVEQRSLRWSVLREALWLGRPTDGSGRRGGRLWLWVVPFVLGFAALQLVPVGLPSVASHDFGTLLGSSGGHHLLHGNWGLFAVVAVMMVFNSVLGEELLFRGYLLPRMRAVCGPADWVVNGILMGLYHLHQPWSMPSSVVAGWLMAYPTRRFRSAWMGIIVHSGQSVFLLIAVLALVLRG